jgi:hypothetical protein
LSQIFINLEKILGGFTDAFVFDGKQTLLEIDKFGIKPKKVQEVILPGLIKHGSNNTHDQLANTKLNILVVARIEKVKICRLLWVTRRCADQKSCIYTHVYYPNYEKPYNPFRNLEEVERILQECSKKYEIPVNVDRRSPRKGMI